MQDHQVTALPSPPRGRTRRMHLTGAAILVLRDANILRAAPAAELSRSACYQSRRFGSVYNELVTVGRGQRPLAISGQRHHSVPLASAVRQWRCRSPVEGVDVSSAIR